MNIALDKIFSFETTVVVALKIMIMVTCNNNELIKNKKMSVGE